MRYFLVGLSMPAVFISMLVLFVYGVNKLAPKVVDHFELVLAGIFVGLAALAIVVSRIAR